MSVRSPMRPTRTHPAGASSALCGRRSVPGHGVEVFRAPQRAVSGVVILLAWIAAISPLRAGGEAGKGEKPRAGKTKTASVAPAKPPAQKKPDSLLPFLQMPEQKAARAEVEASSLASALKKKLIAGEPLPLAEVEDLGRSGLNPELIIKCLRTSGGSYDLLTKDIDRLRGAGLADSVLDFLLTTRSRRPAIFYPSFYYSSWLHHDVHHDDHHFGGLHHSDTYLHGHDHH